MRPERRAPLIESPGMPSALISILAGLASAVSFGAGDFAGGVAARRASGLAVAAAAQLVGLALMLVALAVFRPAVPEPSSLLVGVAAGVSGAIGVAALYSALAAGAMGLVASVSGAGAVTLPLIVSVALLGGQLHALQVVGVSCAALAVVLAGSASRGNASVRALQLALLAAAGFGLWYLLLDRAALSDPLWALVMSRLGGGASMTILAAARGSLATVRRTWRLTAVSGICDIGGNALYVVARSGIDVALAAALSGIYPLGTMVLARALLHERLPRVALVAICLALVAIVLIALG
jgi:drug/metabolite transporter (DMT)-like permease